MAGMSGSNPYAALGTREFSRVRKFDMEERRRRILGNSKYDIAVNIALAAAFKWDQVYRSLCQFISLQRMLMLLVTCQVDKEALDKQVKDDIEYRLKQEKAKEQFEQWQQKKIESMNKAEEFLEAEKKICNQEYELYWQQQRKCRIQKEVDEKMHLLSVNDRIGPFDKLRYNDQDMEPQRSTAIQLSVNHTRLWQEQIAKEKKEQEAKERIDWIQQDIMKRKQLRHLEENIKGQLFERDKKLEREMLVRSQEKHKEARLEHLKNHMYQISPEYFDQFQTTAR